MLKMIMKSKRVSKLIPLLMPALLSVVACTAERNAPSSVNAELASNKVVAPSAACGAEELAAFDHGEGEVVDLSLENLPRGLYLARFSEMLIEKKSDSGVARAIVREAVGGKSAEVICADGLEKIPPESIDIAMTGLVKFDTGEKAANAGITQRQFFFFQDKASFGAVISNPKSLLSNGQSAADLKKLLTNAAMQVQLVKMPDRTYVLKYQRERDSVRARLFIHLDLVQ